MWRIIQNFWRGPGGLAEVQRVALPLVISAMSWTIMQFIDRVMLFHYSTQSAAAALPSGATFFWVICLPLGIASYVNSFVAQYLGAGQSRHIGRAVWQGIWVGVATVPLALLTIPLAPWSFELMGHEPNIQPLETIYYQINTASAGGMVIAAALAAFFTGRGTSATVMVVDVFGALVNLVLDYLWIFGYAGFPQLGIAGAAWATVAAVWLKVAIYFVLFLRSDYRLAFGTLAGWQINWGLMRRLVRFGSPSGFQMFLEVGGFTLFLIFVGRLGEMAMTASSLAFSINMLAFMPVWGIGIATSALVGQYLGRNQPAPAARATWSAFSLSSGYMLLMSVIYVMIPDQILRVYQFSSDSLQDTSGSTQLVSEPALAEPPSIDLEELHSTTVILLRFVAAYGLFDAMNIIFTSALKGAGDTRYIVNANLKLLAFPILLIWFGHEWFQLGLLWSWLVLTLWVMVLGLVFMARFLGGRWKQMRVIETEHAQPS